MWSEKWICNYRPKIWLFRTKSKPFLDASLDAELRRAGELSSGICGAHEPTMRWHRILHKKGWVAPRWPVEHGGTGWSDMQHYIGRVRAPRPCAAALPDGPRHDWPHAGGMRHTEQQQHYLPKLLSGEHIWCQGYSEPGRARIGKPAMPRRARWRWR